MNNQLNTVNQNILNNKIISKRFSPFMKKMHEVPIRIEFIYVVFQFLLLKNVSVVLCNFKEV